MTRPTLVAGVDQVVELFAGVWETCAIRADRSVWCWGRSALPTRIEWQWGRNVPQRVAGRAARSGSSPVTRRTARVRGQRVA